MERKQRIYNAFKAMRALDLPDDEVKPVLKDLLKVFDQNWEIIEAEDYRVLKDAYFERKETEVTQSVEKGLIEDATCEKPKSLHFEVQEDQGTMELHQLCPESRRDLIPSEMACPDRNSISQASQCDASGSGSNDSNHCERNFSIASSALEEVKILLNCDSAVGQLNFEIPDLNAVLKYLEDKYFRKDKLVTSNFSVLKLLKDLCQSYLELGTVSCNGRVAENTLALRRVSNSHHNPRPKKRAFGACNSDIVPKEKVPKYSRFSNSHNLIDTQQGTTRCDEKRPRISDITKGAEKVKISLIDETGNEVLPKFTYMPHNVIYQNAYVHISLARIADEDCCSSCAGDCLSSRIPCACARETGGEFAYTENGRLKEKFLQACESMKQNPQDHHHVFCQECPLERFNNEYTPEKCKGHLLRKFIKECWTKCGCNMNCGNRVVQRGIRCSLQVFLTREGKGWGLRPLEDLPKGSFVCEYVGEILTNMELYERNMQSNGTERHTYPVTLDADWGSEKILKDEEALCLDATFGGNVARFINHRCNDANLIDIPVEIETPDRHYYHDYGIDFDDHDHPIKAFACCCGSAFCRDKKRKRVRDTRQQSDEMRSEEMELL